MRYWLVICYVGHCGSDKTPREIGLAIEAKDSVEALLQAKKFPGVKHSRTSSGEKLVHTKKHCGKTAMLIL